MKCLWLVLCLAWLIPVVAVGDEIIAATGNRETAAELEKKVAQFDRDGDKQLNLSEVIEALKSLAK